MPQAPMARTNLADDGVTVGTAQRNQRSPVKEFC
jgi:hypothetical protein